MTSCIFCSIIDGSIPSKKIYEDERMLAFHDINPIAPFHVLIVPKQHIASALDITEADINLMGYLSMVAKKIATEHAIEGYQLHMNVGEKGGQEVMHIHLHMTAKTAV